MSDPVKLLRELIAIPSVNPAFLPPGSAYTGEQQVAEYLAHLAARAGLEVEFQEVYPKRHNVLLHLRAAQKSQQRILLAPHLDTVGGEDLPGAFFTPRVKNGRLYGRGACDTKGSVAVMFTALCELAASAVRPLHTDIVLAGLVDEECAQGGSRVLARSGFRAQLAVVGEPTRLKVVTAHKGVLWLKLTTRGKAAHGSRPELGRNAVHEMARIVDVLETEYATQLRRVKHPLLGRATVNVGSIAGGRQPNIVPDRCTITVDRRILPHETDGQAMREITALLRSHHLRAEMRPTQSAACYPLETDERLPLVRQFLHLLRQKRPAGVHFFSDGGVLAHGGIPSVLFGPGDIAQAHTPDEWVPVQHLNRGKNLLVRFLRSLS